MKFSRLVSGALFVVAVASACNNSDFNTGPKSVKDGTLKKSGDGTSGGNGSGSGADGSGADGSGADGQIPKPSVAGAKVDLFPYGTKATQNDVLFIFDNSVSMNPHLANVKEGFSKLGAASWSGDVRMAVMTTMPADPANLSKVHEGIRQAVKDGTNNGKPYVGIELEPGFMSFVSAEGFQKYKQAGATFVSSYPEPLCSGEWFKPDAVNSKNQRCLTAALQNPFYAVGCEAGITALSQILDKRGKIFRAGAFAQIVFVSDAQDPGCGNKDLQRIRPAADVIRKKVLDKNKLAGLKFHGAVPVPGGGETKETNGNGFFGFPYNELVNADKGVLIDITKGQDYSAFASNIAKSSVQEPVFRLQSKASKINFVKVNGSAYPSDKIKLSPDGLSVRLEGLDPNADSKIIVDFMPAS